MNALHRSHWFLLVLAFLLHQRTTARLATRATVDLLGASPVVQEAKRPKIVQDQWTLCNRCVTFVKDIGPKRAYQVAAATPFAKAAIRSCHPTDLQDRKSEGFIKEVMGLRNNVLRFCFLSSAALCTGGIEDQDPRPEHCNPAG